MTVETGTETPATEADERSGQAGNGAEAPMSDKEAVAETITCTNPADGSVIDEIPAATPAEVDEAVQKAREAQAHWERLPVKERADYLLDAREVLLDHRRELRDLLVAETGKAPVEALSELLLVFDTIGFYAKRAPKVLAEEQVDLHLLKNKRVTIRHAPQGVVVNISPWNFPLDLAVNPIIPALVAGNAAIVKPSEWTPLVAMRAVELINQAGLPDGLLQVLPGYGDVGAKLVDHADAVSFTGSVATGRKVAVAAAEKLIPSTLELGGKDPAVVLEDANMERATNGVVFGSFLNSGQVCMSTERVYVHEDVYDEFVEQVLKKTRKLRQGNPARGDVDVGAMTFPKQLDIIEEHVEDAVDKGARVLTGGSRRSIDGGNYFEPTILVDVDHDMTVMRDETFGPVMPIMKVPSAAEAIRLANDTHYGLNASVWSTDRERANRLARQIRSGNVVINDVFVSYVAAEAPYGGFKDSGVGCRKADYELEEYTQPQTIMEDIIGLNREPFWYPYNDKVVGAIERAFDGLFRQGLTGKIKGLFSSND